jgi:hypothetical protein
MQSLSNTPGWLVYACNPNTWEAEAEASRVQGYMGLLHRETLSQKKKKKEINVRNLYKHKHGSI